MKGRKITLGAILLLVFGFNEVQAQETANASGGNASGNGGTVSYSVGQIVYSTNTGTNGSVAQGVQQPYEISIVAGIEDASEIILSFSVYPNPTIDYLKLNIGNYKIENLYYELFNINGEIIENKNIESSETTIAMNNYATGIYFLRVIESNKELKSFKIIKN